MSNWDALLPIIHISHDDKGKRTDRTFNCRSVKKDPLYSLMIPQRQIFVQLIKFAPGKGPKDYVQFHDGMNADRRKMDIHEIATFLTWGRYDMVVIWDAPNLEKYNEFLALWINPTGSPPGSSETLTNATALLHPPLIPPP
jgi:uncharacterized protein with GYD domain